LIESPLITNLVSELPYVGFMNLRYWPRILREKTIPLWQVQVAVVCME